MALYIHPKITDFTLLPFPTSTTLTYFSLLSFSRSLSSHDYITYALWTTLSSRKFGFTKHLSDVYFETCVMQVMCDEWESVGDLYGVKVPRVCMVLFLYNQLFYVDSRVNENQHLEECVNPINCSSNQSGSNSSLETVASTTMAENHFPTSIVQNRKSVARYWRSTTHHWLQAIFSVLFWNNRNAKCTSQDILVLSRFFGVILPKYEKDSAAMNRQYLEWRDTKERIGMKKVPGEVKQGTIKEFLECYKVNTLTPEVLQHLFTWAIIDEPPGYDVLSIDRYGMPQSIQYKSTLSTPLQSPPSTTKPDLLLSYQTRKTILIHPKWCSSRTLILHRLKHCDIYIVAPLQNLYISNCKSTHVFTPMVLNTTKLFKCNHVQVSCNTARLVYESPHQPTNIENTMFVNTLVVHIGVSVNQNDCVRVGPLNKTFPGMKGILSQSFWKPHDGMCNALVYGEKTHLFKPLLVCEYIPSDIPFDFPTIDKHTPTTPTIVNKIRDILEKACEKDPLLMNRLESRFWEWFKEGMNSEFVISLGVLKQSPHLQPT